MNKGLKGGKNKGLKWYMDKGLKGCMNKESSKGILTRD